MWINKGVFSLIFRHIFAIIICIKLLKGKVKYIALIILILVEAFLVWQLSKKPMQNRNWALDQKVLSHADINGKLVTVHDIRDFTYHTETDYTPNYYDKTFDLDKIKAAYYVLVPFGIIPGAAHSFLSFEFEKNNFLAVSIEIRKQQDQIFSAWKSAFRTYELMYVVADEKDVIKLRTNYRVGEKVYLYPVKADKQALRAIFLDYMKRVNELYTTPEFYNLFTNTCTTELVNSINRIRPTKLPWSYTFYFPGYSDAYALKNSLLDTDLRIDQARTKFYINDIAKKYSDDPDFSLRIRGR